MSYRTIIVDTRDGVGMITLNRPAVLNALSRQLCVELLDAATTFDRDPAIGAIILTGSGRAFSVGDDIGEMATMSYAEAYLDDPFSPWDQVADLSTPTIAAVAGYAFGGGCELALMCELVLAAPNAVFALPEITIGVMPALGGTQRLSRAIGKARAMDTILTGRRLIADEAERTGLVSRILPSEAFLESTIASALDIARRGTVENASDFARDPARY